MKSLLRTLIYMSVSYVLGCVVALILLNTVLSPELHWRVTPLPPWASSMPHPYVDFQLRQFGQETIAFGESSRSNWQSTRPVGLRPWPVDLRFPLPRGMSLIDFNLQPWSDWAVPLGFGDWGPPGAIGGRLNASQRELLFTRDPAIKRSFDRHRHSMALRLFPGVGFCFAALGFLVCWRRPIKRLLFAGANRAASAAASASRAVDSKLDDLNK